MKATKLQKRPFSKWAGDQIEEVCFRNDGHGREAKPPWEVASTSKIYKKIDEEIQEFIEAYMDYQDYPTDENRAALQWECHDAAATLMMMSSRVDPVMSGLRRGR